MAHDAHDVSDHQLDEAHAAPVGFDMAGGRPVVVSVSEKNPRVRTVRLERGALGVDRSFLPAILVGLGVTARHFFRNVFGRKDTATVEYPDVKPPYPDRFRGVHRLMHREDGSVRCVACMLCPTVCPAHCITIHPAEREDSNEKYPAIFEIDELKCVVCGLCVEACPCDAIRMDSGVHMPPSTTRGEQVLGKVDLMKRGSRSTAIQGGAGKDWDEKDAVPERGPESRVPAAPR
jgi:NADH-quinone oxidoreductase subunit I